MEKLMVKDAVICKNELNALLLGSSDSLVKVILNAKGEIKIYSASFPVSFMHQSVLESVDIVPITWNNTFYYMKKC